MSQEHQESLAPERAAQGKTIDLHPRLRIGFAGARNLCGCPENQPHVSACRLAEMKSWLKDALDKVWACSAEALPDHPLRLVCGMAHGADRIAIGSFHAWRGGGSHELLAVFPCPPEDFRDHSRVEDPSAFNDQRDMIRDDPDHCGELVLDGVIAANALTDAEAGYAANCAHAYQSAIVVRQCDVLVAVLDRYEPGKPGGTRTTINEALTFEKPVLIVDHQAREIFVLSHRDQLRPVFKSCKDFRSAWQQVIIDELLPDLGMRPAPAGRSRVRTHVENAPSNYLQRLDVDLPRIPNSEVALARGWGEFYGALSERRSFRDPKYESESSALLSVVKSLWSIRFPRLTTIPKVRRRTRIDEMRSIGRLFPLIARVSKRHDDAMAAYRGRFIRNYLFGLVAVAIALAAAATINYGEKIIKNIEKTNLPDGGGVADLVGKIASVQIGTMLTYSFLLVLFYAAILKWHIVEDIAAGTHRAKRARVSETAVGLRYQLERLRAMIPLFFAGAAAMRLPMPSARRGQQFDVAEDMMRLMPIDVVSIVHDKRRVIRRLHRLLWGQFLYHKRKHTAMRVVQVRLERAVEFCGKSILWILPVDIVFIHMKMMFKSPYAQSYDFLSSIAEFLSIVGFLLVLATAFLPALMATLNAVLFHSAAEQLSLRHRAMADTMRSLLNQLQSLRESVDRGSAPVSVNHDILALAEKTAAAMAEEVAEWAALYLQSVKET